MDEYAVPILPSRDLNETLDFYARLGFELRGDPPDRYDYLIIGRGGVELQFFHDPEVDPLTTAAGCYVRVPDADALHREWADAGVPSDPATGSRLQPPDDREYGMREFALVDRSGNLLRIGSPLPPAPELDTSVAHPARVYDYWLGGNDNFAADRELGDAMIQAIPTLPAMARANRSFMERVTRHLVESGVTQFLDIGSGIPTSPNLHEIAQGIDPSARVVYVDNDPLVTGQAREMIADVPGVAYLHGDLTDPESISADPLLAGTLDLTRPVALMVVALLMYFPAERRPERWVATLLGALPSGSTLAISHPTADFDPEAVAAANAAANAAGIPLVSRTRDEFAALFGTATLLDPGVVPIATWRPDTPPADPHEAYYYAALARRD